MTESSALSAQQDDTAAGAAAAGDMIGFGIVIPVVPELIMELTGEDLSNAALYGGWLLFVYALGLPWRRIASGRTMMYWAKLSKLRPANPILNLSAKTSSRPRE